MHIILRGQYKKAFEYQEQYVELSEELFSLKKAKEFNELRTQYKVKEKDSEIALLAKENELAKVRRQRILITSIGVIIVLLFLFLWFRHRAKTQKLFREQEALIHQQEKEQLQQEQVLKEVQALIEGQDKERNRIAQELHDGVGGQLASVNLGLSHLNEDLKSDALGTVTTNLSKVFQEIRQISHELSSNNIKYKDFKVLLAELQQQYNDAFSMDISMFPEDCVDAIAFEDKHHLYRIIQEVLTNVSKHANASEVNVSINKHEDELVLIIEDNGVGFAIEKSEKGIGLSNVEERVTALKGKFTVDSALGRGTSLIINIPT